MPFIPLSKLWEWVDEDVNKRAVYFARMVPKSLVPQKDTICLAREVLARYGGRKDVRREISANFSTESWRGSESSHLAGKKQWLLQYKQAERNKNVRLWIDEYIESLGSNIERSILNEERES